MTNIPTRLQRVSSAMFACAVLFVVGLMVTLDLMWRALTGKEGL